MAPPLLPLPLEGGGSDSKEIKFDLLMLNTSSCSPKRIFN
jgi:hypothetical protein